MQPDLTLYVAGFEEIAWGVALVAITMVLHGLGMVWTLRAVHGLRVAWARTSTWPRRSWCSSSRPG